MPGIHLISSSDRVINKSSSAESFARWRLILFCQNGICVAFWKSLFLMKFSAHLWYMWRLGDSDCFCCHNDIAWKPGIEARGIVAIYHHPLVVLCMLSRSVWQCHCVKTSCEPSRTRFIKSIFIPLSESITVTQQWPQMQQPSQLIVMSALNKMVVSLNMEQNSKLVLWGH